MSAKEIGSEFWDVPVHELNNKLFNEDTAWFLSGRSALRAIIQNIKKKQKISDLYQIQIRHFYV